MSRSGATRRHRPAGLARRHGRHQFTDRVRNNPGEDPTKVEQDYYGRKGISETARTREFCGNYDPEGKGDPQRGLKFIREHGMQISTGSPGGDFLGKHKSYEDQKQKLNEFTKLLQQEIE